MLDQLITPQTILSYSDACVKTLFKLDDLRKRGFYRLVIPSRGAYPFFRAAKRAWIKMADTHKEYNDFLSHFQTTLLPFTADLGASNSIKSSEVRKFWVKVMIDSIRLHRSPFSSYYEKLVSEVGHALTVNTDHLIFREKIPTISRTTEEHLIFIDTAMSGKAICEIIDAFQQFDIRNYFIILIVDKNSASLKRDYEVKINREIAADRLELINVEKIFSEDTSPVLNSGICSVVFPNLIDQIYSEVKPFYDEGFVGGGLWFVDSISHLQHTFPALNAVRATIDDLVAFGVDTIINSKPPWFEEMVIENIKVASTSLGLYNVLLPKSTKNLVTNRIIHKNPQFNIELDVTGSHVVRVSLPDSFLKTFIKKIKYF